MKVFVLLSFHSPAMKRMMTRRKEMLTMIVKVTMMMS